MAEFDFVADPDALTRAARAMVILAADFEQARATMAGIGAADFGNPKASSATEHFVTHWGFQAKRLGDAVQKIGEKLSNTAKLYSETEQDLATGLAKMAPQS